MKKITFFVLLICIVSCVEEQSSTASEKAKVALRHVGHNLLLFNNDSTSVVKPVVALSEHKYQLAFENSLVIYPDSLVNQIKTSFEKVKLSQHYFVEVLQCQDNQVAYSYEIKQEIENGIVPCSGRQLDKGCYYITLRFTKPIKVQQSNSMLKYIFGTITLLVVGFIFYKRKNKNLPNTSDSNFALIGRYKFYPEQNKLIKEAEEINLSKKECELLVIFAANPNQVVKRETLIKKVWEDNGVIVGRSLDTYISKLRKKLQDDTSIKLTNVHGVGYKLEV